MILNLLAQHCYCGGALAADLGAKPGSGVDIIPNNLSNSPHKESDNPSVISKTLLAQYTQT